MLTQVNQPVIILQEQHTPTSGKFEPAISWEPSQTINTAEYFDQIEDSLVIEVTATARNVAQMEASATRRITLKKGNRPPVITSVVRSPARTYYQLGSQVEVFAEAVDPDGDSVSIEYLPGQLIALTAPGRQLIKVIATDPEGASDERTDTVFVVFAVIEPDFVSVIDGETASLQMSVGPTEFVASAFLWNWEPKNTPAGNNPHVDFAPSNAVQGVTVPNARWYAFPDDPCSANHESTYRILGAAFFGNDKIEATESQLEVRVPKIGGFTWAEIVGYPQVDAVKLPTGQPVRYRFIGPGSLTRIIRDTVFVPVTSQFYRKSRLHEDVHVKQFATGSLKDYLSLERFFNRIRKLNAISLEELDKKFQLERNEFIFSEQDMLNKLRDKLEEDAYRVSDSIPPLYFHSGCQ